MNYRFLLLFLLCSSFIYSTPITIESLEKKVFQFNDSFEYEKSILAINTFLDSHKNESDQKLRALILKSQTYKRLFNYEEVLLTLKLAEKEAIRTKTPQNSLNVVRAEMAFALFDIHKYEAARTLMLELELKKFEGLPKISVIFLKMQEGYLEYLDNRLPESEKKLNEALTMAKRYSPRDVPNILAKHLELYAKMGNPAKMEAAFQEGLRYSRQYKILKYELYLYEIRKKIALAEKDYEHFPMYQKVFDSLSTLYNSTENIGKVHLLEQKLQRQKNDLDKKYEKAFQTFLLLLIAVLVALAVTLFKYNIVNKTKRELAENENRLIHDELMRLTNSKNEEKLQLTDYNLTERQLEIIQYLKEGKTNKEIGALLFISENTVKYHLKAIYEILNIANRSELK